MADEQKVGHYRCVSGLVRVMLISGAFFLGFSSGNAQAQQSSREIAQAQQRPQQVSDNLLVRFFSNFFNGSQDLTSSNWPYTSGQPSDLRKFPAPQNSPPFPYAKYQIGGTPTIGDRNEQTAYPLMKALFDGPNGQWWKDSRIFLSGWVEVSYNASSSVNVPGQSNIFGNAPYLYDQQPNSVNLHQLDFHAIRLPDTYQTDHIDWGFRVDARRMKPTEELARVSR